ncbi:MAG: hydroxymethylbilane synthase [Deferribacteraceae bacterium]|jgi:hydroxymethylbilane synthase|nr:hydroxymethylbilane synthase [Deferribacteraceae bacterium]
MEITIATRGSALALWQANHIKALIEAEHPSVVVALNIIKTSGDKIQDVPLAKIGGKGLFVKEIEEALLAGTADLAVHSMKDVPVALPDSLEIFANPRRESPFDALLSVKFNDIHSLPAGAIVGTSSLRRKLQLLSLNPNLVIKDLRGNVDTRIRKLLDGEYDAIILAQSGLNRLGQIEHIRETIAADAMLPAICQGALGIEVRKDDSSVKALLAFLKDKDTETALTAERAYLTKLEGGCQAPIGGYATLQNGKLLLQGFLSDLEGKRIIKDQLEGKVEDAAKIGTALAEKILAAGGAAILKEIYK